ncbi:unnamed protein product [Ranitomeya imitator]|uniref:Cytochrome P450 n=1 Tax=Ranitomeya imitator TaxID=111125 RepID=A0ABN9LF60_9NEOB|nr:unnamed protein product [Ranitomeya imitator]
MFSMAKLYSRKMINTFGGFFFSKEEKNVNTAFTLPNLESTIYDMFLAGAETTAITISFGFLILAKYPEIQDKVHKEIDQVIGREKEPRADDRKHMQYTIAFIHEMQRYSDVMPLVHLDAPQST